MTTEEIAFHIGKVQKELEAALWSNMENIPEILGQINAAQSEMNDRLNDIVGALELIAGILEGK